MFGDYKIIINKKQGAGSVQLYLDENLFKLNCDGVDVCVEVVPIVEERKEIKCTVEKIIPERATIFDNHLPYAKKRVNKKRQIAKENYEDRK